jgi:hypothetical protein
VDRRELIFAVLPFVVLVALGSGFWLVFRQRAAARRAGSRVDVSRTADRSAPPFPRSRGRAGRPWWGNPWLWVGVSAVFLVLGIFVWPGLFGGVFVFLPFVWVARSRSTEVDPRTNGHSRRSQGLGA